MTFLLLGYFTCIFALIIIQIFSLSLLFNIQISFNINNGLGQPYLLALLQFMLPLLLPISLLPLRYNKKGERTNYQLILYKVKITCTQIQGKGIGDGKIKGVSLLLLYVGLIGFPVPLLPSPTLIPLLSLLAVPVSLPYGSALLSLIVLLLTVE